MSSTAAQSDPWETLTSHEPDLSRQLWTIWAKETDGVAKRLRVDAADDDWTRHADILAEGADQMGAPKTARVARKARRMTGGDTDQRGLAIKALRVAARLDLAAATPR